MTAMAGAGVEGSALAQTLAPLKPIERRAHVEEAVLGVVRELTGKLATSLTAETPLMEAGVDSLGATEFAARLSAPSSSRRGGRVGHGMDAERGDGLPTEGAVTSACA